MKQSLFIVLLAVVAAAGCQHRRFFNAGRDNNGNEVGIPASSVDEFARQQNLSRDEAREHFRQGQVKPAQVGQIAGQTRGDTTEIMPEAVVGETTGEMPPESLGEPAGEAFIEDGGSSAYGKSWQ